ncbi:MAG: hypothetical protein HC932_04905 [Thermales bacterium]|nr:hypothetical protein [Thermales bacterium]
MTTSTAETPLMAQDRLIKPLINTTKTQEYSYVSSENGLLDGHNIINDNTNITDDININIPRNISQLKEFLNLFSINTNSWGQGEAKHLKDLLREIKLGIVNFSFDDDLRLCRNVSIARITVTAFQHQLVESKQVFLDTKKDYKKVSAYSREQNLTPTSKILDGMRFRKRNQDTINKKIQKGSSVSLIARKALVNELHLDEKYVINDLQFAPSFIQRNLQPKYAQSFPNLLTAYTFYFFKVDLGDLFRDNQSTNNFFKTAM